jgi:aspartate aminotransferase
MKIRKSNATFSSIVGIGQRVKKASNETGQEYLELNRGVNAVTNIKLTGVMHHINSNSKEFQVYAPNKGIESLRKSILKEYFPSKSNIEDVSITPGGMPALDLILQILDVERFLFPTFYWGSYSKMATIRKRDFDFYDNLIHLNEISKGNECVFICDPSNPTGKKEDDVLLYNTIKEITSRGTIVIFDCPYRKLFYDDDFYDRIADLENVIVTESFSKWIGLSGLRIGFIYSNNQDFNEELNIRLLYEFNAVSSPPQIIIDNVLSTMTGQIELEKFRKETVKDISRNIKLLSDNNLLVDEIYNGEIPIGIFAIINKSEEFLFENKIGAVGLEKFSGKEKDKWSKYSRVCVSVPHEKFKQFISKIV